MFKLFIFFFNRNFFLLTLIFHETNPIYNGRRPFLISVKNVLCKHVLEILKEYDFGSREWFQKNFSPLVINPSSFLKIKNCPFYEWNFTKELILLWNILLQFRHKHSEIFTLKWTVCVISSVPPFVKGRVLFTTVPI